MRKGIRFVYESFISIQMTGMPFISLFDTNYLSANLRGALLCKLSYEFPSHQHELISALLLGLSNISRFSAEKCEFSRISSFSIPENHLNTVKSLSTAER
jgi:hypothetical protein